MAVQDIIRSLYGMYMPTGMYSWEFRPKGERESICEIFMLLPPESMSVGESQRSELIPTVGGGYLSDQGNDFKEISVSGSLHFYYVGPEPKFSVNYQSAGKSNRGSLSDGMLDGYTEFLKLRFMLSRYRDYTMTSDGKIHAPVFDGNSALKKVNALKSWVKSQIDKGGGALANKIELVFHDYDYDDHWKIKVDNFRVERSKEDPWTVRYDISMRGYEQDIIPITTNYAFYKLALAEYLKRALSFSMSFHPATLPNQLLIEGQADLYAVPYQVGVDRSNAIASMKSSGTASAAFAWSHPSDSEI